MQEVGEARTRPWLAWVSVSIVALAVAAVVISTTVRATDSDMMGSLLAAESLVQGHWLRFDHYPDLVKSALQVGYRLEEVNGHLYYFFPIGTSLLVAPAIAVLSGLGIEVTPNDDKIQIGLAAVASVLVFLLTYFLARRFLRHWIALLIATVFWFGSSFASTGATALWSHDFGAVMSLGALLALVAGLQSRRASLVSWSGVLAAYAFVVRPQLALLPLGIAILLAVRWRKGLIAFAWPAALVLAAFVVFTKLTSGVWLPSYYLPQRLEGGEFWVAFAGNMVSPGRGLLIYTPILLVILLLLGSWRRITWDERALVLLGLGWLVAHWIAISRFPHWWGGWGFGPRLMMDALPGLVLVVVVLWPRMLKPALAKVTVILFVILGVASVWINTVQALYNPYSRVWYVEPMSEDNPWIMWDWQYPQLLASEDRHEERMIRLLDVPPPLQPGVDYAVDAPELGLVGWSTGFWSNAISLDPFRLGIPSWWPEEGRRWTEGATSRVLVTLDEQTLAGLTGRLHIPVDAYGPQQVEVSLNGTPVTTSFIDGVAGQESPGRLTVSVDPALLRPGVNEIVLTLPTRVTVGLVSDFREIAIALKGLSLS